PCDRPIAVGNECDVQPGLGPDSRHSMVWSNRVPIRRLLLEAGERWCPNLPLRRGWCRYSRARERYRESKQHRYDSRQRDDLEHAHYDLLRTVPSRRHRKADRTQHGARPMAEWSISSGRTQHRSIRHSQVPVLRQLSIAMVAADLVVRDLVFGLLLGCVFSVVAHGLNIIWGIVKVINIAHGEFIMLGAYGAYFLNLFAGITPLETAPIDAAIGLLVGYAFYYAFLHRELHNKETITLQSEMVTL